MAFINKHIKFDTGLNSIPVNMLDEPNEPCVRCLIVGKYAESLSAFQLAWLRDHVDVWHNDTWVIIANVEFSIYVLDATTLHDTNRYAGYYITASNAAQHTDAQIGRQGDTLTTLYAHKDTAMVLKATPSAYTAKKTDSVISIGVPAVMEPVTCVVSAKNNEPAINIYIESGV